MSKSTKIILAVLGVLLFLAVFAAVVLPVLIKSQIIKSLEEATGRNVLLEKVSVNPFNLSIYIRGLAVEEKGGGPFLSIGALKASVSPTSLYRRAPVISGMVIDSPSLRVVRSGESRFNFADIVERRKQKKEEPKKSGIFPFVLENVRLAGGAFEFDDQLVGGGRTHLVRNLETSLPWLSSLPADKERDASLRIAMTVNGAPLLLTAKSRPFKENWQSSVHLVLNKLNLPELAVYLPQTSLVELASGKLTIDADIAFRLSSGGSPDLSIKGLARLDALAFNQKNKQPLLKLSSLEISAVKVAPFAGIFAINAITMEQPELFVHRDSRGEWIYKRLLASPKGQKAKEPDVPVSPDPGKTFAGSPLRFSIASLSVKKGGVHFQDDLPTGGFSSEIREINLDSHDIDNSYGKTGRYNLALQADGEMKLTSAGSFAVYEPEVKASVELTGLSLRRIWPYLAPYLAAPPKGVASLTGQVAFSRPAGLSVTRGELSLENFSVQYGVGEGIALAKLEVEGAAFHQQTNRLQLDRINLSGGDISFSRGKNGRLSIQTLIVPHSAKKAPAPATAPIIQKKTELAKPFTCHLKSVEMDKLNIAFTDHSREGAPRFALRDAKLSLADLRAPEQQFAKLKFASSLGKDATLQISGDILPVPFWYRGDIKISRLPIRDFESYYPEAFNFQVLGGLLDANLALNIGLKKGSLAGSFRGDAGIGALHLVDAIAQEDLLKWQRFQVDRIAGNLSPFRLAVGQVSLNKFYSRIIVREDGTVNLQELIKRKQTEEPGSADKAPRKEAAVKKTAMRESPSPPEESPGDVRIDAVTIADGTVQFTDKHLPNDFETTFYNLGGRISDLSSNASTLAEVDLRGNLENHSPLRITGKINPLRDKLFVDLKLSFSDIELSPMSPYSETYLGYILKQGKLFIDLRYHIENKKLASENRIRIDQFTFGDKVESDKATSLPVKLGLALLKDRHGEINLDIPVTGSLDDPRFNIWKIVFQVVKNLLVKAVTAPFSLLSSLFAGEGDLSVVSFSPGSSVLDPDGQKKLELLAKALNDRPSLRISAAAYVDRKDDAEGYRNELFERKLQREKFIALAKERRIEAKESAEATALTPEERPAYIKALYAREKFPKPRDVRGKEIMPPVQEMVKLILAHIKIDREELEHLAGERMNVVKNSLVDKGKVGVERIFENRDDIFKTPGKGDVPISRVELTVLPQ